MMAIGPVAPLDNETAYYIHVSVDSIPGFIFTTTINPGSAGTLAQRDNVAQQLTNLYQSHPQLTVTSAEKRVVGTQPITPE
jgi:hypothetical protein